LDPRRFIEIYSSLAAAYCFDPLLQRACKIFRRALVEIAAKQKNVAPAAADEQKPIGEAVGGLGGSEVPAQLVTRDVADDLDVCPDRTRGRVLDHAADVAPIPAVADDARQDTAAAFHHPEHASGMVECLVSADPSREQFGADNS
jgi:hypothetical protein